MCLFLVMLAIIPFRIRFGLVPTLFLAVAWWPVAAALQPLAPENTSLAYAVSRLAGVGATTGPSVLHSVTLVALGMLGGRVVLDRHEERWTSSQVALLLAVTVAGAGVAVTAVHLGPAEVVRAYVDISAFRVHNHSTYFAIGALACVALVLVAGWALRLGVGGPHRVGPFSRASLLSFALGNVAINLVLPVLPTPTLATDVAASALLIVALWCAMRGGRAWRNRSARGSAASADTSGGDRGAPAA